MTARYLFILTFLNLVKLEGQPPEKRGIFELRLKGKVKSYMTISLKSDGSIYYKRLFNFDEKGNALSNTEYDNKTGNIRSISNFKYDENGNIVERIFNFTNNSGRSSVSRKTFKYDKNNFWIEETQYNSESEIEEIKKNEFVPDSIKTIKNNYGETAKRIVFLTNGKGIDSSIHQYYDNNNIKDIYHYSDGKLTLKYHFNEKGRHIKTWTNGKLTYNDSLIYDGLDNIIEKYHIGENGNFKYKETYKYDNNHNIVEQLKWKLDETLPKSLIIWQKIIYNYDNFKNKTKETVYRSDGSISFTYIYNYEYY
jgi:hypothetical protein